MNVVVPCHADVPESCTYPPRRDLREWRTTKQDGRAGAEKAGHLPLLWRLLNDGSKDALRKLRIEDSEGSTDGTQHLQDVSGQLSFALHCAGKFALCQQHVLRKPAG